MFKKILLPVDLEHSDAANKALDLALREVERSGAELYVMTVAPGFGMPLVASFFDEEIVSKAMKAIAQHLEDYVGKHVPEGIKPKLIVAEGKPPEQILEQAEKNGIDLIMIPSHDSEVEQLFLGSVSAKVVRHSRCSVLVVKPTT